MKTIKLSELRLSELIRIQNELPKAIQRAKKNEKKKLRKEIETLAAQSGFSIDEIMGKTSKKKKPIKKVAPKFENPDDTDQKWTGRGRRPLWVENHLSYGGSMDDLLII